MFNRILHQWLFNRCVSENVSQANRFGVPLMERLSVELFSIHQLILKKNESFSGVCHLPFSQLAPFRPPGLTSFFGSVSFLWVGETERGPSEIRGQFLCLNSCDQRSWNFCGTSRAICIVETRTANTCAPVEFPVSPPQPHPRQRTQPLQVTCLSPNS